jgi:CHAD domain-containing protein
MKAFVDRLVGQLLCLQINLFAAQARMHARTDTEALHDLRIALRKLRSLIRPLRGLASFTPLEQAARAVGQLSGPLRDSEVLLAELCRRAPAVALQSRRQQIEAGYTQLLRSPELAQLFVALAASMPACRQAQNSGAMRGLVKRVKKRMMKSRNELLQALYEPAPDQHELRILIKRLRYAAQAYPRLKLLSRCQLRALSVGQGALGDWHDYQQWLVCAEQQSDLSEWLKPWQAALILVEGECEHALRKIRGAFNASEASIKALAITTAA